MSPGDSTVLFKALPTNLRLTSPEKRILSNFSKTLSQDVVGGRPFTSLITNDRELQKLNKQFLGHDYPTDVLSFPSPTPDHLGELAISAERADAQANSFGHSRLDEIRVLMLHGLLHLAGMDHETDRGAMSCAEKKWRSHFDLPLTLIARANAGKAGRV
ncbi:MAG: rRNA maturation RNase YbeY [Bryobacteraceae bacterium]